jgi:trimeric autotransporter adhesin
MHPMIHLKTTIMRILSANLLGCFALAPVAQAAQPPKPENRGNGNSAAENVEALNLSTIGANNTAHGWFSLFRNTTGGFNTANGVQALFSNTTGGLNTASGVQALFSNTTGAVNTASGVQALFRNTSGGANTADGVGALQQNTTGSRNTAIGSIALRNNTTGFENTAVGASALERNNGRENTAIGFGAGFNVFTASQVICIGAGVLGANVSNTTWIGNVYGHATLSGQTAPVVVSVDGQLATIVSSERFKKNVATMDKTSEAILSLRPVTFQYKSDTQGTPQFGLIAEEVAKVDPALVLPDKEGKPHTVRYDAVNAMLLNEFLKEHKKVEEQQATIAELKATLALQAKGMEVLTAQLKGQAAQIQKVSAQVELNKPAPSTVANK